MSSSELLSSPTTATGRKRSNSIIPIEFRNDTSDGGMERAALATVFGVREYTESKIFWNAEEDFLDEDNIIMNSNNSNNNNSNNSNTTSFKQVQRNSSKRSYTNQRHVSPIPRSNSSNNNKILPVIPAVSEFGDIWTEVKLKGQQQLSNNVGYSSFKAKQQVDPFQVSPPKDLSDCPLALFDLIQSDENPNFILWGIISTNNTIPPTAPASSQESLIDEDSSHSNKKKKSRWSSLPTMIKKKTSFHNSSSGASFTSMTSNHVLEENRVIEAATIEKLVEKLTVSLDYTFMTDFFLIFRVFMTPLQLCKYLILRFKWSIENNDEKRCIVRIRTFVVMRHWLLNYFLHDFIPSRELRILLTSFLNAMPFHPLIKVSPRDQRIIKGLKRVVRRLKKIYYASSSSATRVQVIGPPPPTFEQEKVAAMVKDKLAQSTIRQKTLNIVDGIHVDARHSGNTAIKNTHAAPVVIIGNYRPKKESSSSTSNLHRRRASSVSSTSQHNPRNSHPQQDNFASQEWSQIQKLNHSDYQERNSSDNSLESALSPGTSEDEEDCDTEDDLSDDDDLEIATQSSFTSKTNNNKVHLNTEQPQIKSNELSEKLEQLRLQQQEEDERIRAEQFLATYSKNPALATATALSQSHSTFGDNTRPRSFYSAQLAIPSTVSTPDIYYTAPATYFDINENNNNNNNNSNNLINSTSYNSMAYPSVTDSEVVTPAMEHPRYSFNTFQVKDNSVLQSQRTSRILSQQDPRIKPLPTLVKHPLVTYAKDKQLPKYPFKSDENLEVWRLSINTKQQQIEPTFEKEKLKKSESTLTESTGHTPRSRIVEIDIAHNHHNPHITIPPPLPPPVFIQEKRSIVLDYSTSLMAQQFCLIERAILLDINWEELVDCKWTKMSTSSLYQPQRNSIYNDYMSDEEDNVSLQGHQGIYSRKKRMRQQEERNNDASERGVEKVISRFNAVCQWVSSEIVQTKSLDDRVKLIEKFIRLAKKCKLYCNFSTLIQILLGLQSSSVSRLEKTWPLVKKREMKILQELSNFTSPTKNWKNIRDSMTQVAEEYGESPTEIQVQVPQKKSKNHRSSAVTIKLPFGGCIPFLGIYLSDLVFNAELPTYLPSNHINHTGQKQDSLMNQVLSQPLVHFRKHRITATVIKRVLVFQNLAKRYSFEESTDPILHSACLHVASLDSDAIYKASCEIEPIVHH